jgi:poly(glycerol-phosphate) alpha-glucosyltransferase
VSFPEGVNYYIAGSRLRPGLDGGYTVATMQRAAHMAAQGARPVLLTYDIGPMDGVRDEFIALGLADESTRIRNLFDEVTQRPELLRQAVLHPLHAAQLDGTAPVDERERIISDAAGQPLLKMPFVAAVDWFRSNADIVIYDAGEPIGALYGFGELYRLWTSAVIAERPGRSLVISEARQLGELLGPYPRSYALMHTVHSAHTQAPHTWDAPMDTLWQGWCAQLDSFDAVVWLTQAQLSDIERRFGPQARSFVVPHPAQPPTAAPPWDTRDPDRVATIARLVPNKQIDQLLRAFAVVVQQRPQARLEVFGDGPQRPALEALAAELGLAAQVTWRGHVPAAGSQLSRAAVFAMTSEYEGQSLVLLEALEQATACVSYDISYGPAEMIVPNVNGELVPAGDVAALAAALLGMLADPVRLRALSEGAWTWAQTHGVKRSMSLLADACERALAHRYVADTSQ